MIDLNGKILFLGCALACSAGAAVITPTVKLETRENRLQLSNRLSPSDWTRADLKLTLFEGREKKKLSFSPRISETKDKLTVESQGGEWKWTTTFRRRGVLIYGESSFTNSSREEMWIEPGLSAAINFSTPPKYFWDGFGKVRKIGSAPLDRRGIKGLLLKHVGSKELPFPAAAVFGTSGGIQLGHEIFDPVSYSAAFYHPGRQELRFTQRFAVQSGETVQFHWVIGGFSSAFGGAEAAIQQHYEAFPERWAVSGGQDNPYIWGNHAQYLAWKSKPNDEILRRLKQSCDWAYCPYKRAGDIVGRKDLWDYQPHNPYDKQWLRFGGERFQINKISREDLQELRRKKYRMHGRRYGWMFYSNCAGTWCELNLAKKYYPDAVNNTDPSANHLIKGWSTSHDWEIRVFPMGTSFAAAFERDMKELTEELDLPGFAFDCGSGGVSYRGPAVKKRLPGRAWDAQGVFIDQSVAVNYMVDFVHSIRPGMTVFINGPLKGDMVMFERAFVRTEELDKMMPLYSWYTGPRPAVNHGHGYMFNDMVANWRGLSAEKFRELIGKLGCYQLFSQFKYGMTGTYVTQYGVPELVYALPELLELRRAGWRALVPVKLSKSLYAPYRAAFGGSANSFLFFGNSRGSDSHGTVEVDNEQLSAYAGETLVFVPKMRSRAKLLNRIDGKTTAFEAVFPARTPVLYETVCAITGAPEKFTVEASAEKTLRTLRFTALLHECPTFTGTLKIRDIRNFTSRASLNGQPVRPGAPLTLKEGDRIDVEYRSKLFRLEQEDIDRFPFADAGNTVSCRVWFDSADAEARRSAERLAGYVAFLKGKRILNAQSRLAFVHAPELRGAAGIISLDARAGAPEIALSPAGGLLLTGVNGADLENTVVKFLDRMDLRYPYIFPFQGVAGMPLEVLKHFKMLGKALPERKFFD